IDALPVTRAELAVVRAHNHQADALLAGRTLRFPRHCDAPPDELPAAALLRLRRAHERIASPLAAEFPEACFRYDLARLEGVTYYDGLCFRVNVVDREGLALPLADGGFVDWTQRLLSNAKERLLTSGIGSEVLARRYR